MTFSDSRIVKMLNTAFVPVWESVAPVKIATFDLGEGRSVKGTISGEIAIYFCTQEGKVFDILPALQSPASTLQAMKEALAFYNKHQGKPTWEAVRDYHKKRIETAAGKSYENLVALGQLATLPQHIRAKQGVERRNAAINEAVDEATRDLRLMAFSKTTILSPETITVVEPGGKDYYRFETAKRFAALGQWSSIPFQRVIRTLDSPPEKHPLKTPSEWAKELFPYILQQPLIGGKVKYNSDSLEAIRIIQN